MKKPAVTTDHRDRHVFVSLRRPPLNILDLETIAELDTALDEVARSAPQLVTLRSGLAETFSAGVSIQDHTPDKIERMIGGFHGALAKLRALSAVTLAEVRGRCLGGGMELAMACDLVLATESSVFAQPEIELGCFPPYAAALYPRRIGSDRALLLLASGRALNGREAERWGLITECFTDDEFDRRAREIADDLLAKSGRVLELTKRAVRAGSELDLDEALAETERIYSDELGATRDLREGVDAFLDKRRPVWHHD